MRRFMLPLCLAMVALAALGCGGSETVSSTTTEATAASTGASSTATTTPTTDFNGDFVSPEYDETGPYRMYQPITDPNDPFYNSMWDDESQEPYDEDWGQASEFKGPYTGTISGLLAGGGEKADVPWGFLVDEAGVVTGGWEYEWTGHMVQTTLTFTGQVSDTGQLTASGVQTLTSKSGGKTQSGKILLKGEISGTTFTGTMTGEAGAAFQVTATRQ